MAHTVAVGAMNVCSNVIDYRHLFCVSCFIVWFRVLMEGFGCFEKVAPAS